MKKMTLLCMAFLLAMTLIARGPSYASNETKEVIEKMITAHGGLEKWKRTTTFSFDNIMFSQGLPGTPFWINKVIVDKASLQVYQEWPIHGSTMAYDGEKAWGANWKIGNPPKFEALFFYYFLNLPWLTQDDNVVLSEVKKVSHAGFEKELFEVVMTFSEKPAVGKTTLDSYKLLIDPESYLLVGYEYEIGYGHMLDLFRLPKEAKVFGPMFRINDSFIEVDGLIYPNLMHTSNADHTQTYGNHAIINYALNAPFDKALLEMPDGAQLDTTSEKRQNQ